VVAHENVIAHPVSGSGWTVPDQMRAAAAVVVASDHEQPVSIFQQLARGHLSGGDDVREISALAAQRRGSAGRARDRHQPRDRPVLVEPVWPNVRRRIPQETRGAYARLSSVADLDEVFVKVNGRLCYLWRAVDHEGEILEAVITARRDEAAALKHLKPDHEEVRPAAEDRHRRALLLFCGDE
jgi:DDE domain